MRALSDLPKGKPFGEARRPTGGNRRDRFRARTVGERIAFRDFFSLESAYHPGNHNSKRYFDVLCSTVSLNSWNDFADETELRKEPSYLCLTHGENPVKFTDVVKFGRHAQVSQH